MDERDPVHGADTDDAAIRRLAHDLTNQFGVIRNYVDLAVEDIDDADRTREDLASIREAAEVGLEMIGRLLALAGRETKDRGDR